MTLRLTYNTRKLLIGTVSGIALMVMSGQAHAQEVSQSLSLPAQPLQSSLEAIGKHYGVTVLAPSSLVAGMTAAPVSDTVEPQAALLKVLEGTGLLLEQSPSGDFVIKDAPAQKAKPIKSSLSNRFQVKDIITVTGTKLVTSLQDVEASVEVFNTTRIDREEIVDLLDVLLRVPNLSAAGGQGNDFSIRGIGRNGVAGFGGGIASNVYVDGAPLSALALLRGPLGLWDTGQIEVLRGSQSSVQGRNALAGAIVISTNDPTYELEGQFRATYARFDEVQLAGAMSVPLIDNQVAARIAVDYQHSDGFIFNVRSDRLLNGRESIVVRGKLLIEPSGLPNFSTKFTLDYSDATVGGPAPRVQSVLAVTNPDFQNFDFFEFQDFGPFLQNRPDSLRAVNEMTYNVSDTWLVRTIVTYETTDVIRTFGLEEDLPVTGEFTRNFVENDVFSAETRLEFEYGKFRGFFGGYYYDEQSEAANSTQNLLARISPLTATANPADTVLFLDSAFSSDIENFAFFGQLEWNIDTHWQINLGFRYDNERVSTTTNSFVPNVDPQACSLTLPGAVIGAPVPVVELPCQTASELLLGAQFGDVPGLDEESSDRFEAFLPHAAVTYNFNDDHSVFISYQRGYRAGGAQFILAPSQTGIGNENVVNTFDPEYLDTIELGTRNVFLDGALIANANIFYSKYSDQQVALTGPILEIDGFDDFIDNAGESTLYGAELSLDYTLNDNWNLFASIGLLETEFDDFDFASTGPFQNLAGNEFPFAPSITFTFTTNYQHESGLYASGTFTFTGRQFADATNLTGEDFAQAFANDGFDPVVGATVTEEIESRSDLTLRVGFRTDRFNVFAAGTNLLNNQQLRSRSFGAVNTQTGEIDIEGNAQGLVFAPRSFRVGVDVSF
ncbi:MAG: TonB-dependent receptor [Pseudomonadota bacterium]